MRNFVDEALLFLVPFVLFALFLLATKRKVLARDAWLGPAPWLMLVGLVMIATSLLYAGISAKRNLGDYVPPYMDNGRVVPGQFK